MKTNFPCVSQIYQMRIVLFTSLSDKEVYNGKTNAWFPLSHIKTVAEQLLVCHLFIRSIYQTRSWSAVTKLWEAEQILLKIGVLDEK